MKTSDTIKQIFENNYRTILGEGNSTFQIVPVSNPRSCDARTITTQNKYKNGWKAQKNWYYTDALHILKYTDSELPRECDVFSICILNSKEIYL